MTQQTMGEGVHSPTQISNKWWGERCEGCTVKERGEGADRTIVAGLREKQRKMMRLEERRQTERRDGEAS